MASVAEGGQIPLMVILESGAADKVVKANIVNVLNGEDLHTDVELFYIDGSDGRYISAEVILMPALPNLLIEYRVYEDDGVTLILEDSEDVVLAGSGSGGGSAGSSAETIVGIIEDDELVGIVKEAS